MSKIDAKNKKMPITYNYKGDDLTIRELIAHPDNISKLTQNTIRVRIKNKVSNDNLFDVHLYQNERVYKVLGGEYTLRELFEHDLNVHFISSYTLKRRIAQGLDGRKLFERAWEGKQAARQESNAHYRVITQFSAHTVHLSHMSQLINSLGCVGGAV